MAKYCSPGYKTHVGPLEESPKEEQGELPILEKEGSKLSKKPKGGMKHDSYARPAGKY